MKKTTNVVLWNAQLLRRMTFVISLLACFFSFTSAQTADSILGRGRSTQKDVSLQVLEGNGGYNFVERCPQGQLLAGFQLWTGNDVDGIGVICVTASAPADVGPLAAGGE